MFICQNRLTHKITHLECYSPINVTAGKEGNWPIGVRRFWDVELKKKKKDLQRKGRGWVSLYFMAWLSINLYIYFL